jgi:gamma-glutamyl-gamma-aminobutyrate hydrolase PuuD
MSSEDELLEYLIKILEETEAGVDLTPCVNGLIIAGDMISSKKYSDKISAFFGEFNYYRVHLFN